MIVLKAEAQRQADQIKGEGDAERNRIFAESFGKDPDFFAFYRSMQAYETAFKSGDTRFLIGRAPTSSVFSERRGAKIPGGSGRSSGGRAGKETLAGHRRKNIEIGAAGRCTAAHGGVCISARRNTWLALFAPHRRRF